MISQFLRAECGATNVEWTLLTAMIVGLVLAVIGLTSGGVQATSQNLETTLREAEF